MHFPRYYCNQMCGNNFRKETIWNQNVKEKVHLVYKHGCFISPKPDYIETGFKNQKKCY